MVVPELEVSVLAAVEEEGGAESVGGMGVCSRSPAHHLRRRLVPRPARWQSRSSTGPPLPPRLGPVRRPGAPRGHGGEGGVRGLTS